MNARHAAAWDAAARHADRFFVAGVSSQHLSVVSFCFLRRPAFKAAFTVYPWAPGSKVARTPHVHAMQAVLLPVRPPCSEIISLSWHTGVPVVINFHSVQEASLSVSHGRPLGATALAPVV